MRATALSVAIHEAGHAVAQLANPPHPRIDFISIVGLPDGLLGLVQTEASWQPYMATCSVDPAIIEHWRQLAQKDVINYLAGPIAELRWRRHPRASIQFGSQQFGERCLDSDSLEPGNDLDRVRTRLLWAFPDDPHGAFDCAWFDTEELVAMHWNAILFLGRALLEKGRIEGADLLAMKLLG